MNLRLCEFTNTKKLKKHRLPHIEDELPRATKVQTVPWRQEVKKMGTSLVFHFPSLRLEIQILGFGRHSSGIQLYGPVSLFKKSRGSLIREEIIPVDF